VVSGTDFLAPRDGCSSGEPVEIPIWACNERAVEVFEHCQLTVVGGMGVWWHGISAAELRAAMCTLRVPRAERAEIAEDVQYMGRAVAAAINQQIAEHPDRA
jgi:hypothetical protein